MTARALDATFSWVDSATASPTAADRSRGVLGIAVDGQVVWGGDSFEWTWIELLEWLGYSWLALSADDGAPPDLEFSSRGGRPYAARPFGRDASGGLAEDREIALWQFLETHDMAKALPGTAHPPFVVWREGLTGHLMTRESHWLVPDWGTISELLTRVAEALTARLDNCADLRAVTAIEAWRKREDVGVEELIEQATGVSPSEMPVVLREWRPRAGVRNLAEAVARSEMLAAARMTADLPEETIASVLAEISAARPGSLAAMDDFVDRIVPDADRLESLKPHEQGHWVAQSMRLALGLSPDDKFDTRRWLQEWGIEYREISLGVVGIDAIAAWGDAHGPVIVVNLDGEHSVSPAGRNASIAHEIGHLLFDRQSALPAAEVLGRGGSRFVEARARAFAAELLLPRSEAGSAFAVSRSPVDVIETVKHLAQHYGVSQEIVAWQARNSDSTLHASSRRILMTLVSAPSQF